MWAEDSLKRVAVSLKVLAGIVCIYGAISGHYPPAHAQIPPALPTDSIQMPQSFSISPYDPMFKADIDAINRRLDDNDDRREKLKVTVEGISAEIHDAKNDQRWYFWILGALVSGSVVIPGIKGRASELIGKLSARDE